MLDWNGIFDLVNVSTTVVVYMTNIKNSGRCVLILHQKQLLLLDGLSISKSLKLKYNII